MSDTELERKVRNYAFLVRQAYRLDDIKRMRKIANKARRFLLEMGRRDALTAEYAMLLADPLRWAEESV
jgi:hypothetical protein